MQADDVFHALHYGNGIRNAQVGVIEIDLEKSVLVRVEVKNISSYHSVKLFDTHMKMYKYFNIGPGVRVEYTDKSVFTPSYSHAKEFSKTQEDTFRRPPKKKKEISHYVFCPNPVCTEIFDSQKELERHPF